MSPPKKKEPTFAESMAKLENIVERMESGELGLEESLKLFEEGVALAGSLGKRLDEVETKIALLVKGKDGTLAVEPFPPEPRED